MMIKGLDIYFEMGIKDTLVDFLLAQGYDDFYFFRCNRYSAGAFLVSAEEQVSARRDFGLFRLFLESSKAQNLATSLKTELKGKNIRLLTHDIEEL